MRFGIALADKAFAESTESRLAPADVNELNHGMDELRSLQQRVDAGLNAIPEGPEKERFTQRVQESRGFFNDYVLPAWNDLIHTAGVVQGGISTWWNSLFAGYGSEYSSQPQMGFAFVALPVSYIAAAGILASAILFRQYLIQAQAREEAILNDPAFTSAQKTSLLRSGFADAADAFGQAKWIALALAVVAIAYFATQSSKKSHSHEGAKE